MQGNYFFAQDMCGLHDCIQWQAERMYCLFIISLFLVFYLRWQGPQVVLLHHHGAQLAQADAHRFCLLLREHMAWCVHYATWHNSCDM
jgi:hypothetical protein